MSVADMACFTRENLDISSKNNTLPCVINQMLRDGGVMRGLWPLIWLALAGTAGAEPFCKPNAEEMAALPADLAGDWQGAMTQGILVLTGKPQVMPANPAALSAKVIATEGGISLADAAQPVPYDLQAAAGDVNFALPGETPLGTKEFLAPFLAEAGIDCAALDLPQFQGVAPEAQGMTGITKAYPLSEKEMIVVFLFSDRVEPKANGVRVVLRYIR